MISLSLAANGNPPPLPLLPAGSDHRRHAVHHHQVVAAMVNNDLVSLVNTRPLKSWKKTLAVLCTYAEILASQGLLSFNISYGIPKANGH
ncbi:hypothetical protein R6Q59_007800 [Mikania micrantha]